MFKRSVLLLMIVSNIFLGLLFTAPVLADGFPFTCNFSTSAKSTAPLVATAKMSCVGNGANTTSVKASFIGPATVSFYSGHSINWTKSVNLPVAGTYQLQVSASDIGPTGQPVSGTETCCSVKVYGGPVVTPAPTAPPVRTPKPTPATTPRPVGTPRPVVTPPPGPVVTPSPTEVPTATPTETPSPSPSVSPTASSTPLITPSVASTAPSPTAPVNSGPPSSATWLFLFLLVVVVAGAGIIALILYRRRAEAVAQTPPVETPPSETPPGA